MNCCRTSSMKHCFVKKFRPPGPVQACSSWFSMVKAHPPFQAGLKHFLASFRLSLLEWSFLRGETLGVKSILKAWISGRHLPIPFWFVDGNPQLTTRHRVISRIFKALQCWLRIRLPAQCFPCPAGGPMQADSRSVKRGFSWQYSVPCMWAATWDCQTKAMYLPKTCQSTDCIWTVSCIAL